MWQAVWYHQHSGLLYNLLENCIFWNISKISKISKIWLIFQCFDIFDNMIVSNRGVCVWCRQTWMSVDYLEFDVVALCLTSNVATLSAATCVPTCVPSDTATTPPDITVTVPHPTRADPAGIFFKPFSNTENFGTCGLSDNRPNPSRTNPLLGHNSPTSLL